MILHIASEGDQVKQRAATVRWLRVTPKFKVTFSLQHRRDQPRARVAELAYRLYEARDRQDGHALEDWLEAERQVFSRADQGSPVCEERVSA